MSKRSLLLAILVLGILLATLLSGCGKNPQVQACRKSAEAVGGEYVKMVTLSEPEVFTGGQWACFIQLPDGVVVNVWAK